MNPLDVVSTSSLDVPHALQSLVELEQEARAYGFDWDDEAQILAQAVSECDEIRAAIDDKEPSIRVQEEIGDLLHTAVSLCVFAGFDVNETLGLITKKFRGRFESLKVIAAERGFSTLHGQTMETMLSIWDEVKRREA